MVGSDEMKQSMTANTEAMDEFDAVAEAASPLPTFWSVAVYLVDRAYGGPEEGGWWYTYGRRIDDRHEYSLFADITTCVPRLCYFEEEAYSFAERTQRALDAGVNKGRRDIGSVLSTGVYDAVVNPGYPPKHFPESRPYYE